MRGEVRTGGVSDELARSEPAAAKLVSAEDRKAAEAKVAREQEARSERIERRAQEGNDG